MYYILYDTYYYVVFLAPGPGLNDNIVGTQRGLSFIPRVVCEMFTARHRGCRKNNMTFSLDRIRAERASVCLSYSVSMFSAVPVYV